MKLKFAPYSFSRLSKFSQCKRKFKYSVIDKAPQNKKDMTPLIKGGAVHSILEHFPATSDHKHAQKYQYLVDKFVSTELGEKYLHREHISEFSFGLTQTLEPCGFFDKDALFRGKIDYICIIDNVLHLVDFKSGKYRDEKWQNYDQLLFYGLYFFLFRPEIQKIKISYVFIEHNEENSIILEREYLKVYAKSLVDIIKATEEEIEFPKTPSKLCPWCEFETFCGKDQ